MSFLALATPCPKNTLHHYAKMAKVQTCYETIKWVENTLVKHPDFALPGRKALLKSDMEYELVLIDATESPIERQKKDKNAFILGKRNDTR